MGQWTKEKAWEWYNARPWIRGCNFMGSDCANRIDQWQEYGFEEKLATADRELALAAYNGGPGNVDQWLANPDYADGEGGLKEIPFRETRQYVKKALKARDVYERLYGEEYEQNEQNEDAPKEDKVA